LRTAEAKLKEKTTKKDPEEEEEEEEEENEPAASGKNKNSQESKKKDRTPAWAKTLMDEVQSLKKEKQLSTIDSKIKSHEKLKDIPADFYEDYLKPEKEEDVDTFAEKVATKYATYKQVDKNNKATSQTKPVNSQTDTKGQADVKEVDAIMDNLMPGTKAPATAK
jgi:hypothetical protein